ncbi:MAG TPA: hypothetical protein DCS07_12540 [Bdellovibrionales bacterium]|nr:MAG: hypothetical protein A2X97_08625 [Bdellovibrionales bacterium GWA1_52_35]HAR43438.1 hypothetical protein [Bdellovibrionales bacterium]HCM41640.1 hypothetical protein [Bdellovibrionales bacterium]
MKTQNRNSLDFKICDFTTNNYDAICEILNSVWPGRQLSPATLQHIDKEFEQYFQKRWVGEVKMGEQSQVVAIGSVSESPWFVNTGTYAINIAVLPAYRNQGIGTAIYSHCIESLAPRKPKTLQSRCPLGDSGGLSFLNNRNFIIHNKRYMFSLKLDSDAAQKAIDQIPADLSSLKRQGVTIKSLKEVGRSPEFDRALHTLDNELTGDIPCLANANPLPFEQFVAAALDEKLNPPGGMLIAFAGAQIVGYSGIFADANALKGGIKMTGVRREWRGKGIAKVLKLCLIKAARDLGFEELETANDETNAPILGLNRKLGFKEASGIIELKKDWDSR